MTSSHLPLQAQKNAGIVYELRYSKFKPVELRIPVDWAMDPFDNRNWRHNLLSLRWFGRAPLAVQVAFLHDFYIFHFLQKRPNSMVGTRLGDHTTALRLESVGGLHSKSIQVGDQRTVGLCERIMRKDIATLLSPKVYRAGHNHGVMADTAILEALDRLQPTDQNIRKAVVRRGMESQAQLFDEEGITREHSISYQEYNYPVVMRFLQAAARDLIDNQQSKQQKLAHATREILAHFTRSNGQFFPVGDSFRLPNEDIRKQYPEIDPCNINLDGGERLFCKGGFFSYFRDTIAPRLHFVATACWNSGYHKQDDDLSFCLELDGNMVFDDPGYTALISTDALYSLSNADIHSGVTVLRTKFGSRTHEPSGTGFQDWSQHVRGFVLRGSHTRVPGFVIGRCWCLTSNRLVIIDSIRGQITDETMSQHSFVLAPALKFVEIDRRIHLLRDDSLVGVLKADDESGSWRAAMVPHVGEDASLGQTVRLTYTAPACLGHSFDFSFG